jgi:putative membrane protein
MMDTVKKRDHWLLHFLQGVLIGTGAILPGVSGGVLCVAFGIYEPIMKFLGHPVQTLKKNRSLILSVLLGGLVGFILVAKVVEVFFTNHTVLATALFSGLICGTVPGLMRKSVDDSPQKGWSCFIITLAVSFVFFRMMDAGMEGAIEANFAWYVFCGFIWGLSMIIPGLSSSSVLLFMGLYQPMTEGIAALDFGVLLPLGLGFLATLAALSRMVNRLLHRYHGIMSKIILGFVISSVLLILPTSFTGPAQLLLAVLCFGAGFFAAHLMDGEKEE